MMILKPGETCLSLLTRHVRLHFSCASPHYTSGGLVVVVVVVVVVLMLVVVVVMRMVAWY